MAHFAELDTNNVVLRVVVANNIELHDGHFVEQESLGIDFLNATLGNSRWVQTSYNSSFRKNFAGVGFTYDESRDAFIAPKPFDSWVLNEETCKWEAPTPMPTIDPVTQFAYWDEANLQWVVE